MELVKSILITSIICTLIYFIIMKLKHSWDAGLKYELIARKIHECLLKKDPQLSIDESKSIIYSIIEEKWFISLKMKQMNKLIYLIETYLNQHSEDFSEFELKKLVNRFNFEN